MELVGLRDGSVIPLGQEVIEDDSHVLFEVIDDFTSRLIDLVDDIDGDRETLAGLRLGDEFTNDFTALEDDTLTSPSDMGEEAMFNGIVLGAVGREMGDADFNANLIDQRLEVLFEDVVTSIVAAAPVAENENRRGVGIRRAALLVPPVA